MLIQFLPVALTLKAQAYFVGAETNDLFSPGQILPVTSPQRFIYISCEPPLILIHTRLVQILLMFTHWFKLWLSSPDQQNLPHRHHFYIRNNRFHILSNILDHRWANSLHRVRQQIFWASWMKSLLQPLNFATIVQKLAYTIWERMGELVF